MTRIDFFNLPVRAVYRPRADQDWPAYYQTCKRVGWPLVALLVLILTIVIYGIATERGIDFIKYSPPLARAVYSLATVVYIVWIFALGIVYTRKEFSER